MLSSIIMRVAAFAIWAPAVYLSYLLVQEFTHGQSALIAGIALIALLVSSISLLTARYAFRRGDGLWGWSSIGMYTLSLIVMVFLELGFWNSTILTSHLNVVRADAAREGVEVIKERQREAVRTGRAAETAAEIEAKMSVQLATPIGNQPLGKITGNCTDTGSAAYRLCGEYLTLKAAHAKAAKAEEIEAATWKDGTSTETSQLTKDIFAGATAAAKIFGGTPTAWAAVFSIALMALLMVTRDLSGLGVFGPRLEMKAKPEAVSAGVRKKVLGEFADPVRHYAPPEWTYSKTEVRIEREPEAKKPEEPAPAPTSPKPGSTPPGKRAPATAPAEPAEAKGENVVQMTPRAEAVAVFEEPAQRPGKRARRGGEKQKVGEVKAWLKGCTERHAGSATTEDDAWWSYLAWCQRHNYRTIGRSRFGTMLSSRLGAVRLGPDKAFVGLVLVDEDDERMVAVA